METDINSIIVTVSYIVTILGGLSGLVVGHYYSRKASRKKRLSRREFYRGIILFTFAGFIAVGGVVGGNLLLAILEPEPVSVTGVIVIVICLLVGLPLLGTGTFIWEFRRKGWVETEK